MDKFDLENVCRICMEDSPDVCNTKETTIICNNEEYCLLDVINSFLDNVTTANPIILNSFNLFSVSSLILGTIRFCYNNLSRMQRECNTGV